MKEAGTGHEAHAQGDAARMDERIAEARDLIEMTHQPGWTRCFGMLQQTAVEAAEALTTLEDPVVFFRCQGTLAVLRRLVDELRRPIEELRHLDPEHPLAVQGLPCAQAFDEALTHQFGGVGKPSQASTAPRPFLSALPPWVDRQDLAVPGLDGDWDWHEDDEVDEAIERLKPEAVALVDEPVAVIQETDPDDAGDPPPPSSAPKAKPGSRKFKHRWRLRFIDRC